MTDQFVIQDSEDPYRVIDAAKIAMEMGIKFHYEHRSGPRDDEGTDRLIFESQEDLDILKSAVEEEEKVETHKQDNSTQVFFYEQDFYVLSNFSAFTLHWKGIRFDTSEAAYHWEKFPAHPYLRDEIVRAKSAHEAFRLALRNKEFQQKDWNDVKIGIMREILLAKAWQHEYVRRKLLNTGDRELIEDSWRDDFWGWGPNKDGRNELGKLWMSIRDELRESNGS